MSGITFIVNQILGTEPIQPASRVVHKEFTANLRAHADAIINAYERGESTTLLEKRYGASRGSVRRFLLDRGVPLKPNPKRATKEQRAEAVRKFLNKEATYEQLAAEFNVSRGAIYNWVKAARKQEK